jgi:hypothetical protein
MLLDSAIEPAEPPAHPEKSSVTQVLAPVKINKQYTSTDHNAGIVL